MCDGCTFVSLLSSLYSVSSVFPKSEFLIMPNMSLRPGHLSSLRSFGVSLVLPVVLVLLLKKTTFSLPTAPLRGRPQLLKKKQKTKQNLDE